MESNVYELEVKRANVVLGSGQEIKETIWGTIIGDITSQKDLQYELDSIKSSIPDTTQINKDINHLKEEKADKSEIPDTSGFASKSDLQLKADKEELGKFALKAEIPDISDLATKTELSSSLNGKADKAELNKYALISQIPDTSTLATKQEVNEGLANKADISSLNGKADKNDVYTKEEVDNKISISTGAVWGSITGTISQQEDLQKELASIKDSIPNLSGVQQDIAKLKSDKADKTEIPDITGLASKKEVTEGLANKANRAELEKLALKSEIPDVSGLVSKTELSSSLNGLNQQIDLKANKVDVYTRSEIDSIFGWTEIE